MFLSNGMTTGPGCAHYPAFTNYVVFMSDRRFEPGFNNDYFCFEPMIPHADVHNAPDLDGLSILYPRDLSETIGSQS